MSSPVIKAIKRKIESECRVFKSSWTLDFFVVEHNECLLCLICQEMIAVFKEYNIKRHYSTKHADKFNTRTSQVRIDRVNLLKDSINSQQFFFKVVKLSSETATKISFLITEAIAKNGKPLFEEEFVKDCLDIFASVTCPDKKSIVESISLSYQTVARRVDDLSSNIEISLIERLNAYKFYNLALDESTDVSDTAQLAIFVRGVTEN
ncbi:General transcription factor II-I repeat domain-containing protein 2A-like [Oopsacas minuta]|uniref:General transcription factor II-I repeat domain-containing protein 2A-like n=1 Tax=Oopsacas minuta TaxID=111878 RepID=A0AAV7JYG1_9METZ|nr:General transcription factor II-I repeat domain-containing protein 2A-like [Oopsacas minuta]